MKPELYVDVYLRDRFTGVQGVFHDTWNWWYKDDESIADAIHHVEFEYNENNNSCDHNRVIFLYQRALLRSDEEWDDSETAYNCVTNKIIVDKIVNRATGEIIYTESDKPESEDYIGEIVNEQTN